MPPSSSNAAMYRSWLLCCFNCISSCYACWLHRLPKSKRGCSQEILLGFYLQLTSHKLVWIPGLAQSGCPIILCVHALKVALLKRCGYENCKGYTKRCVRTNICTVNIELEGAVSPLVSSFSLQYLVLTRPYSRAMDLEKLLVLWQNQSSVSNKYTSQTLFQTLQLLNICKAGTEVFKTISAIRNCSVIYTSF